QAAGLHTALAGAPHIRLTEPLGYLDFLMLLRNARKVLTDSGGVQKEACFHRIPCITLREETEWVETIESGWNVLVGTDKNRILHEIVRPLSKPTDVLEDESLCDGRAAQRIAALIH
ncbi:MAG: UDP-N-acetylglucosamine 2-epimerase, partial [Phycisphaerae bacterium]